MGPHPVSLAAQPLARLRIQDLTPELTCEAPLLNYITFQNWRLEEQITSNLKPDSRTRPKPWLHANFTFSFFSFFSWPLNPVDVHDLTLSIFNIIGSQEKAIQYFHLGYCLVFFWYMSLLLGSDWQKLNQKHLKNRKITLKNEKTQTQNRNKIGKTWKKTQKITRKNKKLFIKILKKTFFWWCFSGKFKPKNHLDPGIDSWKRSGSRNWLLKTLSIQELTPENHVDPGVSSWIRRVFRSQLLDPERFQKPAPGSTWFSGVSSWIDRVFRSQFLDPERFQESIPGSKWFLGLNFPEKHHQKNVFFKILMNNVLFFLVFSCYFLCFFSMFSRFYCDFVFVVFHFLMLFFCFLGVFDSIFVNLIQVEATCIRKNTKQYPKWKYCMAFSWLPMMLKIERVKSWTQDMDPETRPCSTSDFLILEHLGMTWSRQDPQIKSSSLGAPLN